MKFSFFCCHFDNDLIWGPVEMLLQPLVSLSIGASAQQGPIGK